MDRAESRPRLPGSVLAVVAGGVAAALHIGKLPPAVLALRETLGIGLVQAGFLLSLVQFAGMALGLLFGLAADSIGLRRSMLAGLAILSVSSALGGVVGLLATDPATAVDLLLVLRALEGAGFLMAAMPGPGLVRSMAPAGAEKSAVGLWGAYMPFGIAMGLLVGPAFIAGAGWEGWWLAAGAVSAAAFVWVALAVPSDHLRHAPAAAGGAGMRLARAGDWKVRLRTTLTARGPWTLALSFAVYASQWIAVISFLPTIYAEAGVPAGWIAALTALVPALNIFGNVYGGKLVQRGVAPATVLRLGFLVMAVASIAAFARIGAGDAAVGLPPALRYVAICVFSLVGGMVPATLFILTDRLAPGPTTVSTTVGLMQQANAFGQFVAPPAVAWLAHRMGGWEWTWAATLCCSLVGTLLAAGVVPRPVAMTRRPLDADGHRDLAPNKIRGPA